MNQCHLILHSFSDFHPTDLRWLEGRKDKETVSYQHSLVIKTSNDCSRIDPTILKFIEELVHLILFKILVNLRNVLRRTSSCQ